MMTDCKCPGYAGLRETLAYNASANRIDECVFPSRADTCLIRADRRITAAILELGALFGALSAGIYADRYSRRHAMFTACCAYDLISCPEQPSYPDSCFLSWLLIPMCSTITFTSFYRKSNWRNRGWRVKVCRRSVFLLPDT